MAEAEGAEHVAHAGAKGAAIFKQKIGPLPLYAWVAAFAVIWWYLQKNASTGQAGSQTDPAGNVGTINPATGYVYGSPSDQAAQSANAPGGSTGSDTSTSGSTIGGQYPDDEAWGRAAINYLVGLGVDPTTANEAIQQWLSSQNLTAAQQADVNLAVQALGAPPSPPQAAGTAPVPVVGGGGNPPPPPDTTGNGDGSGGGGGGGGGGTTPPPATGGTKASNPPSGFAITGKTATTVSLKWNATANATGYTVAYGTTSGSQQFTKHVTGGTTSTTIGGLSRSRFWSFIVYATPTKTGGAHAGPLTTTLPGSGGSTSTPASSGGTKYTVKSGDTLSGIANKFHYPGGWQALYTKNKGVIGSNPNVLRPGEVLTV